MIKFAFAFAFKPICFIKFALFFLALSHPYLQPPASKRSVPYSYSPGACTNRIIRRINVNWILTSLPRPRWGMLFDHALMHFHSPSVKTSRLTAIQCDTTKFNVFSSSQLIYYATCKQNTSNRRIRIRIQENKFQSPLRQGEWASE